MKKAIVGITIGDPSGIGPEIVLKALEDKAVYEICRPVVIGDAGVLQRIGGIISSGLRLNPVKRPEEGTYEHGTVDIIDLKNIDSGSLEWGAVSPEAGKAAYEYIEKAASLGLDGALDSIATGPINKKSIRAAGIDFIGHTEMLAHLTDTPDPLTMFQVLNMRVFFLSRHVSLREACDLVTEEKVTRYIRRSVEALKRLGIENPLLAVAGLNPHNGDNGLFGDEEGREIEPAVEKCKKEGFNAIGPVPADSVFAMALKGRYDGVLSLYHDQGHIATKTVDFERTISLTIGMPFLRTSVDHGTAFDIAGKGVAGETSMVEAIRLAALYAPVYGKDVK